MILMKGKKHRRKIILSCYHQHAIFSHVLGISSSVQVVVVHKDFFFFFFNKSSPAFIAKHDITWCGIFSWFVWASYSGYGLSPHFFQPSNFFPLGHIWEQALILCHHCSEISQILVWYHFCFSYKHFYFWKIQLMRN